MGFIPQFLERPDVAPLVAAYKLALDTPGRDVGAVRGAIVERLRDDQADERKELTDYLDFVAGEVAGRPRGRGGSNYDKCGRRGR